MSWNYRLIRSTYGEEIGYAVHEVYYDEDGQPTSMSQDPVPLYGDDPLDAMRTYILMGDAFKNPPLQMVEEKLVYDSSF